MKSWLEARRRSLERLMDHLGRGLVDSDIADFLVELNTRHPCIFTTSSCSGRLALIEGPSLFDKRSARIIAVWHDPDRCRKEAPRLLEGLPEPPRGTLRWLSLQPPILHISAATQEAAERIVSCAKSAGFRRACYHRYRAGGYHVEVSVHDKLAIVGPSPEHAVEACGVLEEYKGRLRRLEECLLASTLCGPSRPSRD